jgi:hypothetical protein
MSSPTKSIETTSADAGDNHVSERRREPRFRTNESVEVCILEPRCERVDGIIRDISRSGLSVEVRTPVAKMIHMEVILPNRAIIFGETRYCRRQSDVYRVGVSIEQVYCAQALYSRHVDADLLNLYMGGNGLTVLQVIQIRNHVASCAACRTQLTSGTAVPRGN